MLKFKAFCLDYWQFLCLQPLHGVYKRYVDPLGKISTIKAKGRFTLSLLTAGPLHLGTGFLLLAKNSGSICCRSLYNSA